MDLEKVAPIIETIMKKTLEQKRYPFGFAKFRGVGNKVASGKLRDSIKVVTKKVNNDETGIQVISEEYAQWVQSGRLPGKKGVPIGAIEQWIKERGLQGRDNTSNISSLLYIIDLVCNAEMKLGSSPDHFIIVFRPSFDNLKVSFDVIAISSKFTKSISL